MCLPMRRSRSQFITGLPTISPIRKATAPSVRLRTMSVGRRGGRALEDGRGVAVGVGATSAKTSANTLSRVRSHSASEPSMLSLQSVHYIFHMQAPRAFHEHVVARL